MNKRKKQRAGSEASGRSVASSQKPVASGESQTHSAHLPKKQPALLAISAILFAGWFVFLLVTALSA
jgi:hypothetical protein